MRAFTGLASGIEIIWDALDFSEGVLFGEDSDAALVFQNSLCDMSLSAIAFFSKATILLIDALSRGRVLVGMRGI